MNAYRIESDIAKELGIPTNQVCLVGSLLICGKGNDTDLLCLVQNEDALVELGFVPDLEEQYESPLRSYRRDGVNLIATTDPNFYFAEIAIANAAKAVAAGRWDMSKREDRISFHSLVRTEVLARLPNNAIFSEIIK